MPELCATAMSFCLFVYLSPVKFVKSLPGGSTWRRAGAYRVDSDTLVLHVPSFASIILRIHLSVLDIYISFYDVLSDLLHRRIFLFKV